MIINVEHKKDLITLDQRLIMSKPTWNDIHKVPLVKDTPVVVRQAHGVNSFGCYHATEHASGIIKLTFDGDESFNWDGKTHLIKITHWRNIEAKDLIHAVAPDQQQPK